MNNTENEKTVVAENSKSIQEDNLFLINGYSKLHEDAIVNTDEGCVILSHKIYGKRNETPQILTGFIYNPNTNNVTYVEYNKENHIVQKQCQYYIEEIKDLNTFFDWIDNVNKHCETNHICYDKYNENITGPIIIDEIVNPKNQDIKVIRCENDEICFVKNNAVIKKFVCHNVKNSEKFTDFIKDIFQMCEENDLSIEECSPETFKNMLGLKLGIDIRCNFLKKQRLDTKIISKSFNKNGNSAFIYFNDDTIRSCLYDHAGFHDVIVKPFTAINSAEDFANWIKNDVKVFCNWSGFSYSDYNAIMQNRPDVLYGVLQKITNKKTLQNITDATEEVKKLNSNGKELNQ